MSYQMLFISGRRRGLWTGTAFLAGVLAMAAGCGGYQRPTGIPVSGTVTLDGQPVKLGSIVFSPRSAQVATVSVSGGDSATATIQDGKFTLTELDGPPAGMSDVQIIVQRDQRVALDDEQAFSKALTQGKAASPVNTQVEFKNPKAKSVEIVAGGPALTFEMITSTVANSPGSNSGAENP